MTKAQIRKAIASGVGKRVEKIYGVTEISRKYYDDKDLTYVKYSYKDRDEWYNQCLSYGFCVSGRVGC